MIYEILKHYLAPDERRQRFTPLKVDVCSPDYHLYLYAGKDSWFVLIETDYAFVKEIPDDIEESFPVQVKGWRTTIPYWEKTGKKILPPHVFQSEQVNESDEDWEHYNAVTYQGYGMNYFLLEVEQNDNA